jgi:hypothetical protein
MNRSNLLIVTAFGEGGIALLLLVWPSVPLALLLGVDLASPETLSTARLAGGALVALSVACWLGRNDQDRPAQQGLLLGVLIYDVAATAILGYSGWFLSLAGIALWPAVVLHVALAVWCAMSFWMRPGGGTK